MVNSSIGGDIINNKKLKSKKRKYSNPIDAQLLTRELTRVVSYESIRNQFTIDHHHYQDVNHNPFVNLNVNQSSSTVSSLLTEEIKGENEAKTSSQRKAYHRTIDNNDDVFSIEHNSRLNFFKSVDDMKDQMNSDSDHTIDNTTDANTLIVNTNGNTSASVGNVNGNGDIRSMSISPHPQLASSLSAPHAILVCRRNSHPFQERKLPLDAPAKVGRAVARCKPSNDNAIFDCKVLSRNHALLWYDDSKFYLQDTRSSNGTFINNQRLSPANEESAPREVCSGDIVQFGVDVMENSKKVTHGCIIATIKLYMSDGSESKASRDRDDGQLSHGMGQGNHGSSIVSISTQELYQLSQLMSEAMHREQILENKLATLTRVVSNAQESADNGWKSLVEEDRLLSRIETLQSKLEICLNSAAKSTSSLSSSTHTNANSCSDDGGNTIVEIRDEMLKLLDDKEKYECAAKEAIQKALEEKLMALTKIHELEATIASHDDECNRLKDVAESAQKEINILASRIDELSKDLEEMSVKLKASEDSRYEVTEAAKVEKQLLDDRINDLKIRESELNNLVTELKTLNDAAQTTIEQLKLQITVMKHEKAVGESQSDSELERDTDNAKKFNTDIEPPIDETHQLQKLKRQLECSNATCSELNAQIELLTKQQYVREQLSSVDAHDDDCGNRVAIDLSSSSTAAINGEVNSIACNEHNDEDNKTDINDDSFLNHTVTVTSQLHGQMKSEIELLRELLSETRASKKTLDEELLRVLGELESVNLKVHHYEKDIDNYQQQLSVTRKGLDDKREETNQMKIQTDNLRHELNDAKRRLNEDNCKLLEASNLAQLKDQEINSLKGLLEEERRVQLKYSTNLDNCRKQLHDAQQSAKQSHAEAEHLRRKVYSVNEELRSSRSNLSSSSSSLSPLLSSPLPSSSGSLSSSSTDCDVLKSECDALKSKMQSIESELQLCRDDNCKLFADYEKLQHSYQRLQTIKDAIEANGDDYWKVQFNTARGEADDAHAQLSSVREELLKVKEQLNDYCRLNDALNDELRTTKDDYDIVSYQSRIASACAIVPLFMLLIAILIAYYPSVASVTGTTEL